MQPLVIAAAAAVVLSVPLLVWSVSSARSPHQSTLRNLRRTGPAAVDLRELVLARSARERALRPMTRALARVAHRFTPSGVVEALERRIVLAGQPPAWPLERVLAAKVILAAAAAVVTVVVALGGLGTLRFAAAAVSVVVAYVMPDLILHSWAASRQQQIETALPDTLDQITVCVEAGLGFDAAMSEAGRTGEGPLAEELVRTLQEMQLGASRSEALRGLLRRTETPDLRRLVHALLQAEAYGIPIANVLRTQSGDLRVRRRQRAEERAMKVPVKLVFPLVLCILPALFVVILGPTLIDVMEFLGSGTP